MTILSATRVSRLRTRAERFFDSTAVIFTRTLSTDTYGAQAETFAEGDTVACRLDFQQPKPTQKDSVEGGATVSQEVFHLALPHDAAITEADRVVVNDNTYAVVSSLDDRSWAAVKRLLVKRV